MVNIESLANPATLAPFLAIISERTAA
jgi:hypothetical protein